MTPLIYSVLGFLLLAGGRKFFWLFVGAIGFFSGFTVADQILAVESPFFAMGVGFVMGVMGIIIALFMQRFAILASGFLGGSYISFMIVTTFGLIPQTVFWAAYIAGGIIGAVLLFSLFDWALIALSSVAGATVIAKTFAPNPFIETTIAILLSFLGIYFQSKLLLREKS